MLLYDKLIAQIPTSDAQILNGPNVEKTNFLGFGEGGLGKWTKSKKGFKGV